MLDAYREFSAHAPRELTSVAILRIAPPAPWLPKEMHGKPIAAIFVCHSGNIEEGEALVNRLRKVGKPVADIVTRRPIYTQMQSLLDATQPKGRRYYWKSSTIGRVERRCLPARNSSPRESSRRVRRSCVFRFDGALNAVAADHSPPAIATPAPCSIAAAWTAQPTTRRTSRGRRQPGRTCHGSRPEAYM